MKMTIELPGALVKQLKGWAARQGLALDEMVADLVRKGLALETTLDGVARTSTFVIDEMTGLPLIKCKHRPISRDAVAPERLADILLSQEVIWQREAGR